MVTINLFKIPPWLAKSPYLEGFYENVENEELGSKKYIKKMNEPFDVQFFSKTSDINSLTDFINIYNTANFFQINPLPLSIYYFSYFNKDNVIKFLKTQYISEDSKEYGEDIDLSKLIKNIENNIYILDNKYLFLNYSKSLESTEENLAFYKELQNSLNFKFIQNGTKDVEIITSRAKNIETPSINICIDNIIVYNFLGINLKDLKKLKKYIKKKLNFESNFEHNDYILSESSEEPYIVSFTKTIILDNNNLIFSDMNNCESSSVFKIIITEFNNKSICDSLDVVIDFYNM